MPLYRLHIDERNEFIPDPEGIERTDLAAAERSALRAAGGLIAEAVEGGERDYRARIVVEDERGDTVSVLTFACAVAVAVPAAADR